MASNSDQYTIPIAIDPRGLLTGLEQMEQGLTDITAKAKGATSAITESFIASGKASETLAAKMDAGAKAAKNVSDAAKAAGLDLSKAFSGDNIKTTEIVRKVSEFTARLKDAAGKPVEFKFNINQSGVKVLVDQLTKAKSEMQAFNLVLANAKDRLSGLTAGSDAFNKLNLQIQTAETFIASLKDEVTDLNDEVAAPPADKKGSIPKLGDDAQDTVAKVIPLRTQLKLMKQELQELEQAGKFGSEEFVNLSKRAGEVADQIQDTSQRIKNLASDTKGIDAGITAIRGLAGAFAIGQGTLAVFGEQSEEAARAIQKVQGALAILQGVQEVANVLNKDSAIMVYLKTFAIKADTAATVVHTEALAGETVATEAATVATEGLTTALLANPLTAIIAIVAVAAFTFYKFAEAQRKAGLDAEQFNKFLEAQQKLLEEDLNIISRRVAIEEANANNARRNQSFLQEIRLNALKEQKKANQAEFIELSESRMKLDATDKDYEKSKAELNKKLEDLETKRKDLFSQIRVEEINLTKTQNEERIKLQADLLKQRQIESATEVEIAKRTRDFVNQIQDAKIAELRESQEKELKILDQGLKVKIQGLESEQKAKLVDLNNQRTNLSLERALADENGKKVIDAQITNISKQIELVEASSITLKNLEVELTTANEVAKNEVIKKYAEERRDIEFQVATTLLDIQKKTAEQREAIIRLAAEHEIDLIERTNQDKATKNLQEVAIEKKRDKDIADSNLEFRLKRIDLDKIANENKIIEQKKFFDKSRDGQVVGNLLLAQNQLEADQKKIDALKKAGKDESDEQVLQLRNSIARAKGEIAQLKKDARATDIFELLFPGDKKGQDVAKEFVKTLDEVGKAVDAYTSLLVSEYQRQIDAQKQRVQSDDDELGKLQDRLKEEQDLKKKGFANNVDGIRKEIEAKNKQRDDDIRKQQEYQKKMEEIQRKALIVQTAIQAANLITASTKIYLEASALGPVGVAIGIASVAAMITAFVASKAQAFEAANAGATVMEKGGLVKGKSHAQGGQKYYAPDAGGGIVELEADEFVTSKRQTEKYLPLLQVINDDKLKDMDERALVGMLAGLGMHFQENQHKEVISEAKQYATHQINQINVIGPGTQETPKELANIDRNLQLMMNRAETVETVTEENGYRVYRKGNFTKRVKI